MQSILNNMVQQDQHAQLLSGFGWRFKVSTSGYASRVRNTKTFLIPKRALTGDVLDFRKALDLAYHR